MSKVKGQRSKVKNIDIDHVAKLANLSLTVSEKEIFTKQLEDVLEYISNLNKLNTEKTVPIGHITGLQNVTRKDYPAPSISQKDAIKNAPRTHNGYFQVDAIFDQNDQ